MYTNYLNKSNKFLFIHSCITCIICNMLLLKYEGDYMKSFINKCNLKTLTPYLWICSLVVTGFLYFLINNGTHSKIYSVYTDLDDLIPFISIFIIPYMLYMPYVVFSLFFLCYKSRDNYYITLITLLISNFICLFIYLFFQTEVPRPNIVENDFISNIVKYVYASDKPFNCFPSIHVAITFSVIKGINRVRNMNLSYKLFFIIFAWLIIVSTQLVKQHVVMDLFASLLLVQLLYNIVSYLYYNPKVLKNAYVFSIEKISKKLFKKSYKEDNL